MTSSTTKVEIAGQVRQGAPILPAEETIILPIEVFEEYERIYRVADASLIEFDIERGDLLIFDPRKKASTGELVIVRADECFYVGRWWAKHGRRDVVGADSQRVIVSSATIIGAINLIVRSTHGR